MQGTVSGAPQDSVIGPFLFNLFINYFVFASLHTLQVCFYADDISIFAYVTDIEEVIEDFDIESAISWFRDKSMVANPNEFQMMFLGLKENRRLFHDINVTLYSRSFILYMVKKGI